MFSAAPSVIPGSPRSKLAAIFKAPDAVEPPVDPRFNVSKASLTPRTASRSPTRKTIMPDEGHARAVHNSQRNKLKAIMQTVQGSNGELNTRDLVQAAKLAKIDLPEEFLRADRPRLLLDFASCRAWNHCQANVCHKGVGPPRDWLLGKPRKN